jgi:uncharacterized membrane protein YkvA (DUF1232 family)
VKRLLLFWRVGRSDLRILWAALKSPSRPAWLIPVVAVLTVYAIEPINFAVLPVGLVDDLVLLPLALHWIVKLLPPHLRTGGRPFQRAGPQ